MIRVVDKLDKMPARRRATSCSLDARARPRRRPTSASRWPRSSAPTPASSTRCARSASQHQLLDEGLRRSGAADRGDCARRARDRFAVEARPAARPRPRLLHRHGLRDLHGRLRVGSVRSAAAAGTTPSRPTARRPIPGVGISFGISRARRAADRARPARRRPVRAVGGPGRAAPTRSSRESVDAIARAPARPRHPDRGRATSAQKYGRQIRLRRASRHPVRLVPRVRRASPTRSRTSVAATRPPADATTWAPPDDDLRPQRRPLDATKQNTRDPHPRRRRPARRPHRTDRHPGRLGRPAPRPRRRRLHRPARRQRRRPGRHPRRGGRPPAAQRVLPAGRSARSRARPAGNANPNLPTGEIEVIASEVEVLSESRGAAVPGRGAPHDAGQRGGAAQAPLPRPAPARDGRATSGCAPRSPGSSAR